MSTDVSGFVWGKLWSVWYPFVTSMMKDDSLVFMNYGYHHPALNEETLPLQEADEPDRMFAQLYYQTANFVDLAGKNVLEVSSGHGGGASFLSRYLKPASYTGLERNPKAVAFCQQRHADVSGLRFVQGDAQNMDLPDESVDAVVNVEASHSYGSDEKFFSEVSRVLKPGGHFLTTDFRPTEQLAQWRERLTAHGLSLLKEDNITNLVLDSMDRIHEQRMQLIRNWSPSWLHGFFKQFAGVQGSGIYDHFKTGERVYVTFALQKDE